MQTHLIYGKMSGLWKQVAYKEELKPEVKALQEKLRDCKLLMKQKIGWKETKNNWDKGSCSKIKKTKEI